MSYMNRDVLPTFFYYLQTRAVGQYPLTRRYPEGCEPASCDIFIGVAINAASSGYLDFYMEASAQAWVASGFSKTRTMVSSV